MKTGAVIAAAGMSTRMGRLKQLMKIGDMTMTERVVLNFRRSGIKDIVMVTGYQAELVEKSLRHLGITFLRNREYETTQMFDSAKLGFRYLKDRCDRILFCPADVPFFSDETVEGLLGQQGKLIFPVCGEKIGHPICIDASLIPEILEYQGDRGLKGALDALPVKPVRLCVEDEGAVTDADTEEDYNHLIEIHNARLKRPQVKVCLAGKKTFFGPGTATLLKQIDSLGSVREACEKTGISYSKAWTMIHSAENELGYRIVERQPGGKNGGQASVSVRGKQLLQLFELYEERVERGAVRVYNDIFLNSELL